MRGLDGWFPGRPQERSCTRPGRLGSGCLENMIGNVPGQISAIQIPLHPGTTRVFVNPLTQGAPVVFATVADLGPGGGPRVELITDPHPTLGSKTGPKRPPLTGMKGLVPQDLNGLRR